ncbi:SDR family NAD(P)-dependent oxidoreductase [Streptomyces sp. NPDC102279]|uniref:SDR family NAD(P)-dependent oxidoreductase n=1 Tax=Streptomyces sp. NPDC102279 TaxID=3366153 RepID=UPI00380A43B1
MSRLSGKVAVITGGASGIGAACARRFVAEGARVVITDIRREEGEKFAAELGDAARFVQQDVTQADGWDAVIARAEEDFGPIAVLVNNAGIAPSRLLDDTTEDDFRKVIEINLIGNFLGIKAVLPSMRRAGRGSIVNISSSAGLVGGPNSVAYTSSKFGNRGLAKAAALALASDGIRVNSVHPGPTNTPLINVTEQSASAIQKHVKDLPLGRLAEPSEIANMVLYLASDESSYSTGSEFVVDAGFTAK